MEVEYHEVRGPRPAHCGRLLVGFLVLFSPGDFLPDFLLRVCSWLGRRGLDRTEQEYVRSSRGVQLFTCGWLPAAAAPKALVFLCHGKSLAQHSAARVLINDLSCKFSVISVLSFSVTCHCSLCWCCCSLQATAWSAVSS
jgi:hypothetical protein